MALSVEIERAWNEHGEGPEEVAALLGEWIPRAQPEDIGPLVALVLHLFTDHIPDPKRALALVQQIRELHAGDDIAVKRACAVFRLVSEETSVDSALESLGEPKASATHQARVLALAAASVGARGRAAVAARWFEQACRFGYGLPDKDPAVQAIAVVGNNLACALEEKISSQPNGAASPDEVKLLKIVSAAARAFWERAGGWLEVERAEYRLAMSSLALGEPFGAAAHAEACRTICEANRAPVLEVAFAHEALVRSRAALGDLAGAKASREALKTLLPAAGQDAPEIEAMLSRLEPLLAS